MKKMLLFLLMSCFCVSLYSKHKIVKSEYQETGSNTYIVTYYDDGSKFIKNKCDPFEGVKTDMWQGNIDKISDIGGDPDAIFVEVLESFHKVEPISFYIILLYDLKGYVQSVRISIPPEIEVPITIIEKLEKRLKQEVRLGLEYDSNKAKNIKFIGLTLAY